MPAVRPLSKEAQRKAEVFKALLAGSTKNEVSEEFNLALHYVTRIYTAVIQKLAVEVERTGYTNFPYRRELFSYQFQRSATDITQWLDWTRLTLPRVRKHAGYWLELLDRTDLNK